VAQPNSHVQVNNPTTQGKKLATYEFLDGEGCVVDSEAVTLTDATGAEILGPRPPTRSIPVVATSQSSTLDEGHETPVTDVAAIILHANPHRVTGLVQNTGGANIRVGRRGVTATTGYRLVPNATIIYEEPNVNTDAIWAIREGATDSVAFSQEEAVRYDEGGRHDEDDDEDDEHRQVD
jgi:hypothetical protein